MPVPFSSPRRRRAIIIGGSMSGLFAAAFLRQKGWDADVYERSTVELVGRGAGITTHPELLEALRTSGAGTRDLGVEVEKRITLDRDGIRSSVRAQVAPAIQPIYSGYYIWRGAPNEADLKPQTRESIFPYFAFFLPERQQIIGYPIAGLNNDLRFGHRRYNFIWYRVGDTEQLRKMCVDENGHQHEYSVPPPLIRKDLIAQMRADAEAIMPPQFLDCLNRMRPFFTPIYDFSTPQLVFGRVALVGDAASSARPHMGFGMAKAGGDTQALAEALGSHDDIDAGLAAYNRIRQPIGERIMLHGRKLGTHLGVNLRTDEDRAMWKLLQDDRAMMDWIAVPNFLAAYR